MISIAGIWYLWGLIVALVIGVLVLAFVFAHSLSRARPALAWQILAALGFLLPLPSWLVRNSAIFQLHGIGAVELLSDVGLFRFISLGLPAIATDLGNDVKLFLFFGIIGLILSVVAGIGYLLSMNVVSETSDFDPSRRRRPPPGTWTAPPEKSTRIETVPPSRLTRNTYPANNLGKTKVVNPPAPSAGWLVVQSGVNPVGKQFSMIKGDNKIGRDSTCQVMLDSDTISREHAKVNYLGNGQFEIIDLGSRNRIKVNNKQVQRQMLYDGDVIQLGEVRLIFKNLK